MRKTENEPTPQKDLVDGIPEVYLSRGHAQIIQSLSENPDIAVFAVLGALRLNSIARAIACGLMEKDGLTPPPPLS